MRSFSQQTAGRLGVRWLSVVASAAMVCVAGTAGALAPKVDIDPQGGPDATVTGTYGALAEYREFLGIRYSDAKRFVADMTPLVPSGQIDATSPGSICPQVVVKGKTPTVVGAEDCLFLNIWTPLLANRNSKLPVLLFIHGGAFVQGASTGISSNRLLFDGAKLVHRGGDGQGLVVVTFNYRLGTLGFLALAGNPALAGNYGFQDQVAALRWVQSYIGYFGGDPGRVTVVGQSAGAISVGLHAWSSKVSSGLFQAAVMDSNPLGLQLQEKATALATGQTLLQAYQNLNPPPKVACSTTSCLQSKADFGDLTMAGMDAYESGVLSFNSGTQPNGNNLLPWGPNLDGSVLATQPLAGAKAKAFTGPVLLGTNGAEGGFFEYVVEELLQTRLVGRIRPAFYTNFLASLFSRTTPPPGLPDVYTCYDGTKDCGPQFARLVTDYVFTCANHRLATLLAGQGPVFAYRFDHPPMFEYPPCTDTLLGCLCKVAACHSAELPFVWNNDKGACDHCSFSGQEATLAHTLSGMWGSMVGAGNPNGNDGSGPDANTQWPQFGAGSYLLLDLGSFGVSTTVPGDANCAYWDTLGYEGIAP